MWVWICQSIINNMRYKINSQIREMRLDIKKATDLGSVLDTTVGDSEGVDCPVQVESMLRFPKRQSFSQGSLINLNDVNACLLKILNFVLDGQSNLVAGFMSAKIHSDLC